jgi:hypothetical protein
LPQGCAFAPRCSRVTAFCETSPPSLLPQKDGRKLACAHPIKPAAAGRAERRIPEDLLQ